MSDSKITFSQKEWDQLQKKYSQEQIIKLVSDRITKNKIPFPFRKYSKQELESDFKALCDLDTSSIMEKGEWFTRFKYSKFRLSKKYMKTPKVGCKTSNYYMQDIRLSTRCTNARKGAPVELWNDKTKHPLVLRRLWCLKYDKLDEQSILGIFRMYTSTASQFRPPVAKTIYDHYLTGTNNKVLDISAGWGDRLIAAIACKKINSYTGIDPNSKLHPRYSKIIKRWGGSTKVKMIEDAAEDCSVAFGSNKYDLIFTSPPYFNAEQYNGGKDKQTWCRYTSEDDWLTKFLFPVLEKCWKVLKPKGKLIINISDTRCNHKRVKICDPMVKYMNKFNPDHFECIGMRMSIAPGQSDRLDREDGDNIFCEPVFVWTKK